MSYFNNRKCFNALIFNYLHISQWYTIILIGNWPSFWRKPALCKLRRESALPQSYGHLDWSCCCRAARRWNNIKQATLEVFRLNWVYWIVSVNDWTLLFKMEISSFNGGWKSLMTNTNKATTSKQHRKHNFLLEIIIHQPQIKQVEPYSIHNICLSHITSVSQWLNSLF